MAAICRAVLGDEAYLFWEQYVIKAADPDTTFAWHQDSGYVHEDHEPYLTCWIALDDVTEENGSVYLLPTADRGSGPTSGTSATRRPATRSATSAPTRDAGDRPGRIDRLLLQPVIHRSGANLTDRYRRVYLLQYSAEVIMDKTGQRPWGSFEQFLADGESSPTLAHPTDRSSADSQSPTLADRSSR